MRDSLIARTAALETVRAARRKAERPDVGAPQLGSVSRSAGTAEIETWNIEAARALAGAESELAEVERSERQQDIRAKVAAVASGRAGDRIRRDAAAKEAGARGPRQPVEPETAGAAAVVDDEARHREIAALIDRLPIGATAQERDAISEQLTGLAEAAATEFGSRLVGLKAEMQRVERAIGSRAEARRRAEHLLRTLDGLEGAEMAESRGLLQRVISGRTPLLEADVERVTRARSAATADFERHLVATKIEEALRLSGIAVGAGFATDVVNGEKAYAATRSSDEHAVELQLRVGLVDMRIVRASGASDPRRDTAAEIEFCEDVERVSSELHGRGVDLTLISSRPSGAVSVEVVPRAQAALAARRRGRARPIGRKRER